jgi:uncharacterized protein (TIGR02271 family)
MTTTPPTLFGVFENDAAAQRAVDTLHGAGFGDRDIYASHQHSGGFASGLKNFFSGDDTTETVGQDLSSLGLPEDEATYYDQQYQAGHAIVGIRASDRAQDALAILQSNGAQVYSSRVSSTASETTTTEDATTTQTGRGTGSTVQQQTVADLGDEADEARRLRLREEQLNVSKERVQAGQVGLHKEVIEEQKTIDVPVTHEEVYIERRPVTDGVDDGTPIGEGEQIQVPVSAEQVNVSKHTVTTGEVAIGKRQVEETQHVSDTVRREEARLDQQGDVNVHDTTSQHKQD